jgi:hypothetical protein
MEVTINRYPFLFTIISLLLFLTACGSQAPACPAGTGTPRYLTISPNELPTPMNGPVPTPVKMKIQGKDILVDKVVEGPLCNDTWSGTVYVSCNVQVYAWVEKPTFLKNCNLSIAPDAVVYVAYHHDTPYYKGCSCHTGEITGP